MDTDKDTAVAQGGDLFIVDNNNERWKVATYLRDWCDIAKSFDVASGYFEIGALLALDGQWQKLDGMRILMGDEVSLRTNDAFRRALDSIENELDESLELEKEKNDFLTGVPAIVQALSVGKIKCRVYRERKFHAKTYITHGTLDVIGSIALVGSSNFTYPGLHQNVELNVQVRGSGEVERLKQWFEHYWLQAEDITSDILRVIERHVREYSPFEVYAKALQEFFVGHEMTADEWEQGQSHLYKVIDHYQKEGYHALLKRANEHRGAFLCDGVGLGKTFIGMMLIERLLWDRQRVALFVPKAARDAVWESKLAQYLPGLSTGFSTFKVFNHSDLLRVGDAMPEKMQAVLNEADVILVDEAHHFRNQASRSYRRLFDLAKGKRLFLLTATPINNSLLDLQHLIELITQRQADYFKRMGIHSLAGYFRKLDNELEQKLGSTTADDVDVSMIEAEQVLDKDQLFRELVVQRSRAYARASQDAIGGAKALFPKRQDPQVAEYSLAETYGYLLDHLEKAFNREEPLLALALYYPLNYSVHAVEKRDFAYGRQMQVVGLIRTQLLKRFESSAKAFEATCERLLIKLLAFITKHAKTSADNRRLERWTNQHVDLIERVKAHRPAQSLEDADEDIITPELLEDVTELSAKEFKVDEIVDETYLDLDQLVLFLTDLRDFRPERDSKLQALIHLLKTDSRLQQGKVLIFSEYMETARYIAKHLAEAGIGPLDQVDSATNRNRADVITAFSPYYNGQDSAALRTAGKPETRVLVATDVLSEGLNLQDATLLINYDLHWNPVRLMQRIGRVDRRLDPTIETRIVADHPEQEGARGNIHYWNFLPPGELERLLRLYKRVTNKTLRISRVFGIEGKKLLRPDDDYNALKEFNDQYEGKKSVTEEMRLALQVLYRDVTRLEQTLAGFPLRVFSARQHPQPGEQAVFFCYSLPAASEVNGSQTTTRWYLFDLRTGAISENFGAIYALLRCERDEPRRSSLDQHTLVDARKKVEAHIRNTHMKAVQAQAGTRPVLKVWMELS